MSGTPEWFLLTDNPFKDGCHMKFTLKAQNTQNSVKRTDIEIKFNMIISLESFPTHPVRSNRSHTYCMSLHIIDKVGPKRP